MAATLPGRVSIAATPTPIQPLPRLGAGLGLDLSVKRDDLTGFAESGNKARKLEFLVHDALEQGADTLITVGALQSNCARATAVVAARLGLGCVLGLRGTAPETPDGNLYRVRRDNYMGQNFGKIAMISDSSITLTELIQDTTGSWSERTSNLQLLEEEEKKK